MASKDEVREGLERVAAKLDTAELKEYFTKFHKSVQFDFPDIDLVYVLEIAGGMARALKEGAASRPDVRVTLDSETFLAILSKKTTALDAYSAGKIKYKGAMTDLLKLQRLL
jgi:putative sterol carrier protein